MLMGFKEWINSEYGGHVFVFYETDDLRAAANAAAFLVEGGRTWSLDKKWSVRMDNPHPPNTQKHTHVMFRGDDVSIINRDGTQSHGTNRDQVPNWVIDRIKQMGLIENRLLVEGSLHEELRLTYAIITSAHRRARWHDLIAPIARRI